MGLTRLDPPLEYLRTASRSLLQSFELTRLNNAANIRKEITTLVDQWINEAAQAMLARWMLEHRNTLHAPLQTAAESAPAAESTDVLPLPDLGPAPARPDPAPPRYADRREALAHETPARSDRTDIRIAR